ncbi:hypothetical protein TIFTF001_040537 [Ficus carica]|uniref:Protein FAR1-RELATED SEQUENCE n=1 Tax=Ficus carica TaxID=3494 RepID=A0AA88CN30_FICCA|nr:hypothetical protein TIFTF001_040537 [Ficus carica]
MFFKVRAETKREGKYMVTGHEEEDGIITCYLRKYAAEYYLRCVTYHKDSMQFKCECNMFASKGYPCRHIFSAMKSLEMTKLPENMILSRWTKHAKGMVGGNDTESKNQMHKRNEASWFGDISHICSDIAWYASRDEMLYRNTKLKLESICHALRSSWLAEGGQSIKNASSGPLPGPSVKNPIFSRTKGSSSTDTCQARKKRCGDCKQLGHNKATCKLSKARTAGLKYGGSPDIDDSANKVDSGTDDVQSQHFDDRPTESNQAENCRDILLETITPKHINYDNLESGGTSESLDTPYKNDQSRYSNWWWGTPYGH